MSISCNSTIKIGLWFNSLTSQKPWVHQLIRRTTGSFSCFLVILSLCYTEAAIAELELPNQAKSGKEFTESFIERKTRQTFSENGNSGTPALARKNTVVLPLWLTGILLLSLVAGLFVTVITVARLQISQYKSRNKTNKIRELEEKLAQQNQKCCQQEDLLQELQTRNLWQHNVSNKTFLTLASDLKNPLAVIQSSFIAWLKQSKLSDVMLEKARLMEKSVARIEQFVNHTLWLAETRAELKAKRWIRLNTSFAHIVAQLSTRDITLDTHELLAGVQYEVMGNQKGFNLLLNALFNKILKGCHSGSKLKASLRIEKGTLQVLISGKQPLIKEYTDNYEHQIINDSKQYEDLSQHLMEEIARELAIEVDNTKKQSDSQLLTLTFLSFRQTTTAEENTGSSEDLAPVFFESFQEPVLDSSLFNGNQESLAKCLIIEPCTDLQMCLSQALNPYFQCKGLFSWENALMQIRSWTPDIIIVEIEPDTELSFSVLKERCKSPELNRIPVIVVTTRGTTENRLKALEYDVDVFFEKPVSEELLVQTLKKLQQKKQQNKQQDIVRQNVAFQPSRDAIFLSQLNTLIETNIANAEFRFEDYFEQFALSKRQFFRRVNALTRCTPKQYLIQKRLELARHLFSEGVLLAEVTKQCGFKTERSLLKIYEAHFGEEVI